MPSKLETAKNELNSWLSFLQNLLDDKEQIKEWLEELSLWIRWNKKLFSYRFNDIYSYLEDDFWPEIQEVKKQINDWKLSKRKCKILFEDTSDGEIFCEYLSPIQKLFSDNQGLLVTQDNRKAHYGYSNLYDWLDALSFSIIEPIRNIIRYWLNEDRIDENYFYFNWHNNDKEETSKSTIKNTDILYSFKQISSSNYIYDYKRWFKYKIWEVELDSQYDVLSKYLSKSEWKMLLRRDIEQESNVALGEGLSNIKKHLGFQWILLKVFCEGKTTQDKIIFHKDIYEDRLRRLELFEDVIEEYLDEKFWQYREVISSNSK